MPVVGGTPSNAADAQKNGVKRSMTNKNDEKEDQKVSQGKVTKDTSDKEEEKLGAPTSVGGAGS